jgi:16S rRNA processing protein RimM
MNDSETTVTVARIGKTQGLKGWLRIHSFTDPQSNLANYSRFSVKAGQVHKELELDQLQPHGTGFIGHFVGYDQLEDAKVLVGLELQVAKAILPDLEKDEFYWHQLQSLSVINLQGDLLGQVERLMETGANDVLVVTACEGSIDNRERLIPYLKGAVVTNIDLQRSVIEVDWDADYLA